MIKRRLLAILFVPGVLCAQAVRQGPAWWESAWWNGPLVQNLDLNDAQRKDIRVTVREYRGHLLDLREAVQRTDSDLETILNASPVDQRKATEAIDRLANARAELTRTLSQMTLRLRGMGLAAMRRAAVGHLAPLLALVPAAAGLLGPESFGARHCQWTRRSPLAFV